VEIYGGMPSTTRLVYMLIGFCNSIGMTTKSPTDACCFQAVKAGSVVVYKTVPGNPLEFGDSMICDFQPKHGDSLTWAELSAYMQDSIRQTLAIIGHEEYNGSNPVNKIPVKDAAGILYIGSCPCRNVQCMGAFGFSDTQLCRY
jgi:hypothetical protein